MTRRFAALVAAALMLAACGGANAPSEEAESAEASAPRSDAGIQLFQYPWTAVGEACEGSLANAGISWVLLSPAQEHPVGDEWWWSYQPVSYQLESRLGTRDEFAAMVETCHAAGIQVYADAVINHMSGIDGGTGFAGTEFTHYEYPGLYGEDDFHHCGLALNDDISSYQDAAQVQTCELVNLADLATGTPHVQETIGAYLADLAELGVDGLRIDAAKHMAPEDIAAIVEGSSWSAYLGMGEGSSYAPDGEITVVPFVANHDTERNGSTLAPSDGAEYQLANALMLIQGYGTPALLDSYAFSDRDAGAPTDSDGRVLAPVCGPVPVAGEDFPQLSDGEYYCPQGWPQIRAALRFDAVAGEGELTQLDEDRTVGVFSRGGAIAVVNRGDEAFEGNVATSLAEGEYCEVAATLESGECVAVTVDGEGNAALTVPAMGIAILTSEDTA